MTKYHINKHGVPAVCRAKEGNCPNGGASGNENHYDNKEDAQIAADKINSAGYGIVSGIDSIEVEKPKPKKKNQYRRTREIRAEKSLAEIRKLSEKEFLDRIENIDVNNKGYQAGGKGVISKVRRRLYRYYILEQEKARNESGKKKYSEVDLFKFGRKEVNNDSHLYNIMMKDLSKFEGEEDNNESVKTANNFFEAFNGESNDK